MTAIQKERATKLKELAGRFPETFRGVDLKAKVFASFEIREEAAQIEAAVFVASIIKLHPHYIVRACVVRRPDINRFQSPSFIKEAEAYETRAAMPYDELVRLFSSRLEEIVALYQPLCMEDGVFIRAYDRLSELPDYSSDTPF